MIRPWLNLLCRRPWNTVSGPGRAVCTMCLCVLVCLWSYVSVNGLTDRHEIRHDDAVWPSFSL